jgi:4-hydroxy-tetrahydrodipicolinate reductase
MMQPGGSAVPIRLLVNGARGRMGSRICALAREDDRFALVAAIDMDSVEEAGEGEPPPVDAIIDFSSDDGAARAAAIAAQRGAALLVGTTALSQKTLDLLGEIAHRTAVMIAPNTSLGVAVMSHLAAEAARLLGRSFDIDIIDVHHAAKRDAPSGTALRIAESVRRAGGELPPERIHSLRAGDVIGEHALEFCGSGERLKIVHAATSRDLFAVGALRAAAWLHGRPPGRYTIEDSLALPRGGCD